MDPVQSYVIPSREDVAKKGEDVCEFKAVDPDDVEFLTNIVSAQTSSCVFSWMQQDEDGEIRYRIKALGDIPAIRRTLAELGPEINALVTKHLMLRMFAPSYSREYVQ